MSKGYYEPHSNRECHEGSAFWNELKGCTRGSMEVNRKKSSNEPNRTSQACDPRELVQNGGFELPTPNPAPSTFLNWTYVITGTAIITASPIAYEGAAAFRYNSIRSAIQPTLNNLTLTQNVNVTPGCLYKFSFAENFFDRGTGATAPRLTARVYYVQGGKQFNLAEVTIVKGDAASDSNRGYSYHDRITDVPVPCNVSNVVVEFNFEPGFNAQMIWLLDGVSLQAVSSTSVC